jgi:hypothetical protein
MTSTDAALHPSFKDRARREIIRFFILFFYLWVMLGLFQLHAYAVLAKHGIPFVDWGLGFINALVLAKVMLLADNVRIAPWLRKQPLIVPALLRSIGFAAFFIVVDTVEKVVVGVIRHHGALESVPAYGGGGLLGSIVVGTILAFGLIPLFAFEEVSVALGPGKLGPLLFGGLGRAH